MKKILVRKEMANNKNNDWGTNRIAPQLVPLIIIVCCAPLFPYRLGSEAEAKPGTAGERSVSVYGAAILGGYKVEGIECLI
jgi:hypothetical protein